MSMAVVGCRMVPLNFFRDQKFSNFVEQVMYPLPRAVSKPLKNLVILLGLLSW